MKTINTIIADLAKKYLPEKEQEFRAVADLEAAKELCYDLRRAAHAAAAAHASYAANAAYAAYAYATASYAADAAAHAAYAANAAYAAAAAAYAAYAAASYAADAAAYAAYAAAAERDKILTQAANNCLEVLKEMKSPGCEFLYLIEEQVYQTK